MKTLIQSTIFLFIVSFSFGQTTNFGVGSGTVGASCSYYGNNAGRINTGFGNTFLGHHSGFSNTNSISNTFLGAYSGYNNLSGYRNIFIGDAAGYSNTSGHNNIFVGPESGVDNTSGSNNSFLGDATGKNNTTGFNNTFFGYEAGSNNTVGFNNIFIGHKAGQNTSNSNDNIYIGNESGSTNVSNILYNVFVGHQTGTFNTAGDYNTFIGTHAGQYHTTGDYNAFVGGNSGNNNTVGEYNSFLGKSSGQDNTTANENTYIGHNSGAGNQTGDCNTLVGASTSFTINGWTESGAFGCGSFIDDDFKYLTGNTNTTVIGGYAPSGWTTLISDQRYKNEINSSKNHLSFILDLEPKVYKYDFVKVLQEQYKQVNENIAQNETESEKKKRLKRQTKELNTAKERSEIFETGLLAQNVEKAMKDNDYNNFSGLVLPEENGGRYALGYGALTVPLIGAVKELKKEKDSEISELKEKNLELEQRLIVLEKLLMNQEEAKITEQKVSLENKEATISQNIPNPFSESTVINYFISQSSKKAAIRIVNSKGNVIRDININEFGEGKLNLSIKDFKSGMYSYSLIVDNEIVSTKKMIISN